MLNERAFHLFINFMKYFKMIPYPERYNSIPAFAENYPEIAKTLEQVRLPFYCCNCQRKRNTYYINPNFGPFCKECLELLDMTSMQEND